jgi:hypothetical protein
MIGIYLYNNFTLAAWVKTHTLEYNRKYFILSTSNGSYPIIFGLTYKENSGPYYSYNGLYTYGTNQANTALQLQKWQHLTYTLSGSNLKIYINGVSVYDGVTQPIIVENHLQVSLGLHVLSHLPKAEFDDLMIFNKSLTQNEIFRCFF